MYLLDVNVLISLIDPFHVHHEKVTGWFVEIHRDGWATCPITQNGFIRILGNPNYPQGTGSTVETRELLARLCEQPGHQFWEDSLSLTDKLKYPELPTSKNLTDYYLLALVVSRKAKLATLDQRIAPAILTGGESALFLL